MEVLDLNWVRLVLDHGSDLAIFASLAGVFLGIPLVMAAVGATIAGRFGRTKLDGGVAGVLLAVLGLTIFLVAFG